MNFCKCGNSIPEKRKQLGYSVCISCSTEEKWSGVQVVHHKTGNEIQVVKDPEVAAEFIAKSSRKGFGTLKGMVGNWKKPPVPRERKEKQRASISSAKFTVSISRKEVKMVYKDEEIGPRILEKFEIEGKEEALKMLESEFRNLTLSPICRKRLLYMINL